MKYRTGLMAAAVMALPVAALAQPISGLYVAGGFGYNMMQNERVNGVNAPGPMGEGFLTSNAGFVGLGSVGYGLGNGLRFEVEGDYRQNGLSRLNGLAPAPGYSASGNQNDTAVMLNMLYDIDLRSYGITYTTPYVGLGFGYDWTGLSNTSFTNSVNKYTNNSTQGAVAYQLIVGTAFPISSVPGLAVTAEYRAFFVPNVRNFSGTGTSGGGASVATKTQIATTIDHSLLLGLRYSFGAPAMAMASPTAPPPAAMSRNYLVFFDWDRADLTARAKEIIGEAAANTKKVAVTKIAVNGYTDLSGTKAYNQALSVRRAKAVAAELVKDGVPMKEIGIQGFGESNPLVKTADGVREPQNRRVEIIFQ